MKKKEHIKIHKELHKKLDELVANFISHTSALPSKTTIMELIHWSYKQTLNPTEATK